MHRFVLPSHRFRTAAALSAAGLLCSLAPTGLAVAPAAAEATEAGDFSVASLPDGGWRVELKLDAPLPDAAGNVSVSGFDLGAYCYSVAARVLAGDTPCSSTTATARIPHWTPATFAPSVPLSPMLRLQWSAASVSPEVRVALGPGQWNVTKYDALTFRLARDEAAAGDVDLDSHWSTSPAAPRPSGSAR